MRTTTRSTLTLVAAIAIGMSGCSSNDGTIDTSASDGVVTTASMDTATTGPSTSGKTGDMVASHLEQALADIVEETGVPALGAAIFDSDGLIESAVAGVRRRGDTDLVEPGDAFHIGSNTKAMTAALVARLEDSGGPVGFDVPLADALGDEVEIDAGYESVTLAHLLSHTGGAPTDDELDVDESVFELPAPEGRAVGSELVLRAEPRHVPGAENAYSNAGYVVVAAAVEAMTGRSWENLLAAEVFEPLAMDSCGFGPPGTPNGSTQPYGHDAATGEPVYFDNPELLAPAGGVHCSLEDWGTFLVELLRAYRGDSQFLSQPAVQRLFEPADVAVPGFSGGASLGWLVADGPEGTAFFHNGSNTAWFSQAAILPDIDRVVIAAANEAGVGEQATALAFAALNEVHPS